MSEVPTPIQFTEVTLRDGEQMRTGGVTLEDRKKVFGYLAATGADVIEVGHLGNPVDRAFVRELVGDITESPNPERMPRLQVLFGSQQDIMAAGISALDGMDKDRVVIHAYDRLSPNLRGLATRSYSAAESAHRVLEACRLAYDRGYRRFSISGEGTTDPDVSIDDAVDYYAHIIDGLADEPDPVMVNVNVANTFGYSLTGEWDGEGYAKFHKRIKEHDPLATTSIHTHNDFGSAADVAIAAVRAGFDRIEGTMTGMGERTGNVALVDVMARLLEEGRVVAAREFATSGVMGRIASKGIWDDRVLPPEIVAALPDWYAISRSISDIYETMGRFERTSLGNPEAYNSGCGPHDQAVQRALEDPSTHPIWKNYMSSAVVHALMGRPEARAILSANPDAISSRVVDNHAAGGSTARIVEGDISAANFGTRFWASIQTENFIRRIIVVVGDDRSAKRSAVVRL